MHNLYNNNIVYLLNNQTLSKSQIKFCESEVGKFYFHMLPFLVFNKPWSILSSQMCLCIFLFLLFSIIIIFFVYCTGAFKITITESPLKNSLLINLSLFTV